MNIAFVISESFCVVPYHGIKIQAQTWGMELTRQGHTVTYVSPWDTQRWEQYDVIHLFGYNELIEDLGDLWKKNHNIVFSPIIDTKQNLFLYKLITYWGCNKLRLKSTNYNIRRAKPYIKHWYVRSKFEFEYVNKAYGVAKEDITIVRLSYKIAPPVHLAEKKDFCLHVSKLTDGRKNVLRLVKAAQKYKFNLVLAGSISSEEDFRPIRQIIESCTNISYWGRVSDERLLSLYHEAKVFALPSINEGVGLVAVEAAACGCNIVVTNVGGPKEYYNGMAYEVDPLNSDEIGRAIVEALKDTRTQPDLQKYILSNYSLESCVSHLAESYRELVQQ